MQPVNKSKLYYGWYIVAVVFVCMLLAYGIRMSFSVFFVAMVEDFGWTRAETAGMFSINMVVYGLSSVLGGYLIDRFGGRKVFPVGGLLLAAVLLAMSRATALWHFYILYGVVLGLILSSMGYVAFTTVLSPWFSRLRGAAMGIALTGSSAASLLTIFSQYLISATSWRGSFQMLGLAVLVIFVPISAIVLRRRPEDIGLVPDGEASTRQSKESRPVSLSEEERIVNKKWASTPWTLSKAMRTFPFWGIFLEQFLIATAGSIIIVHQVAYSVGLGFSKIFAATIFGLTGVFSMLGIFGGALSDRLGRERAYVCGNIGLILSLSILLATGNIVQPWMLFLFTITYGISRGINAPLYGAITADLFQGKKLGTIMGVINLGFGLGSGLGSWLAGFIFDLTKSYSLAFLLAISTYSIAIAVIWLVVAPRRVRRVPGQIKRKEAALESWSK